MDENRFHQVVSSLIHHQPLSPTLIVILVLLIIIVLAMITFFFVSNRDQMQLRRLFLRVSFNNQNTSIRTIPSPNNRGQFQPAIWCRTCNEFIDHVDNLCPHVGRKFYFSVLYRRFYEFWRHQLSRQFRSTEQEINKIAETPNPFLVNEINLSVDPPLVNAPPPNITIDLEELIGQDCRQHSIQRKESSISIISSNPCQTSTPTAANRDRRRRRIEREASTTSFDRIRQMWNRFSGRSVSSASSGVGSSIRSRESQEEPVPNSRPKGIRKFFNMNRRCISDLHHQRSTSTTRLIRRPTPTIKLHRCSTRRRRLSENAMDRSETNFLLQPNGTWNGQTPVIQRSMSQRADKNCQTPRNKLRHYNSDVGPISINVRRIQRHNASTDLNCKNFSNDSSILLINHDQFSSAPPIDMPRPIEQALLPPSISV